MLMERSPSPVVALNRAIVLAELGGPQQGLNAITDVDTLADSTPGSAPATWNGPEPGS